MRDSFVEFREVEFRFVAHGPPVLGGVSFSMSKGEFFCLLGPSGCGKTTVLNLLAGFEAPTRGVIRTDGRPVLGPGVGRSVVFQGDDSLFPWLTAVENAEFGLRMRRQSRSKRRELALEALNLVGLSDHGHKYPGQLSGGMKQRIQIARALVCEAPVLLMDEPFGALDAQMRSLLQQELAGIWQKTRRTILFITHDIGESLILADRIGLMTAGPEASIREIVTVDLARPRRRDDIEFGRLYEEVNSIVSDEVRKGLSRQERTRL